MRDLRRVGLEQDAIVADLIDGQEDGVEVVEQVLFLDVLAQDLTNRVEQAREHAVEHDLVGGGRADHVEEEINVATIDDR